LTRWLVLLLALTMGLTIPQHWQRRVAIQPHVYRFDDTLDILRQQEPGVMVMVTSRLFEDYYAFYDNMIRASFGNPDYRPNSDAEEFGDVGLIPGLIVSPKAPDAIIKPIQPGFPPRYSIAKWHLYQDYYRERGYVDVPSPENYVGDWYLFENQEALPYAFVAPTTAINTTIETAQAITYFHAIDTITAIAPPSSVEQIIVLQETAYAGWQVQVNDEVTELRAVVGNLAVIIPPSTIPTTVTFTYKPTLFYIGAAITMITILVTTGFMLRLDKMFIRY
jgi:hypothetical protein